MFSQNTADQAERLIQYTMTKWPTSTVSANHIAYLADRQQNFSDYKSLP